MPSVKSSRTIMKRTTRMGTRPKRSLPPLYDMSPTSSSSSSASDEDESEKGKYCLYCKVVKLVTSVRKGSRYCSRACEEASVPCKGRPTVKGKLRKIQSISKNQSSVLSVSAVEKKATEQGSLQWKTYLLKSDFIAAPVSCFKHVALSDSWGGIIKGFRVEVINLDCVENKRCQSKFYWVASVQKIAGYHVLLRYEGFETKSSSDFWVNMCTAELHHLGWCVSEKKNMIPPEDIKVNSNNWPKYLSESTANSRTLPRNFTLKLKESLSSRFVVGTKVEVVDKNRISCVRVAKVGKVIGGRVHLRYEDYEDDDGFWCHERSPLIHPIGWAQIMNHHLFATQEYARKSLEKTLGLNSIYFEPNEASWDMFLPVLNPATHLKFQEGMKLEAIDPLNLSTICVATVTKVLRNNYLMIGIDGMMAANGSDWFCYHASSPCIFPVGFCDANDLKLTPPRGYKGEFRWEEYLKFTKARAAPIGLFEKEIPDHGFKEGMYLEAVDLMEPRLICVGSVTKVVGRLLRIHFDGWDNDYDQWCDCESPDLYPVGWCQMVGYPLEPPRSLAIEDAAKKKRKLTFYKGNRRRKRRVVKSQDKTDPEKSIDAVGFKEDDEEDRGEEPNSHPNTPITSPDKRIDENAVLNADPNKWNVNDVGKYLQIEECGGFAEILMNEEVDGPMFLTLTKEKLLSFKDMKVGPALKIALLVQRLKQKVSRNKK